MPELKAIRKVLERVAATAGASYGLTAKQFKWPNKGFDDSSVDLYIRPTIHRTGMTPMTLGPNTRVATRGFFKVGVFSRAGQGPDKMDELAETVKAAYPYGTDLDVGGVKLEITRIEVGDMIEPPGWAYRPVDIYWSIGI